MKKVYYLLLLALPFLLQSCLKDDKDIFDKSPAERLNEALKHDQEILMGATNGWIMEYYPNKSLLYGGFTLLMKFEEGDRVTVASELAKANQTETSMYQLIGDSGPVLTFNTHNSLIHYFSDPQNPDGIGPADTGMGGDYEFLVLEATPEKVTLKGKKTGNKIVMTPVEDGVNWANLLQKYIDSSSSLKGGNYDFKMGDVEATATASYRTFTFNYPGENEANVTQTVAYRVIPDAISFYEALEIGDKEITQMSIKMDASGNLTLVDEASGAVMTPLATPLNQALVKSQWYFHRDNMSPAAQALWDTGYEKLLAKGWELYYAFIGTEPNFNSFGFCFGAIKDMSAGEYEGTLLTYTYQFTGDNEITLTLEGNTTQIGLDFYNSGVKEIVSIIKGAFTIIADNPSTPTLLQLTNKTNPDIQFVLTNQDIYFPHYSE